MNIDCNLHVASYIANKLGSYDRLPKLKGPLNLPEGEYEFRYDYPLSTTAKFRRKLSKKTTARNILRFAARDYVKIYKSEEDPGYVPGMMNRASSEGDYGIWGHYLDDLFFEGIRIDTKRKVVTFIMGS